MDKYILCSDDGIILEHEDETNNFTITFDVNENFLNLKEIFVENMFFYLIKELNDSIILDYSETINESDNRVLFKIKIPNEVSFKKHFNDHFNLYINYDKTITDEKVNIFCIKQDSNVNELDKNNIYFEKMNIVVEPNKNGSSILFNFYLNDGIDIIMNKFVALYIKKLIKKLKIYFDK